MYQDLQVIQMASVAENIMLDKIPTIGRTGMVDWKALDKHASEYMQVVGLDVPPMTRMSSSQHRAAPARGNRQGSGKRYQNPAS